MCAFILTGIILSRVFIAILKSKKLIKKNEKNFFFEYNEDLFLKQKKKKFKLKPSKEEEQKQKKIRNIY